MEKCWEKGLEFLRDRCWHFHCRQLFHFAFKARNSLLSLFCLKSNYIQAHDTNKAFPSPSAGSRDSPNSAVYGLSLTRASTALGGEHQLVLQMSKDTSTRFPAAPAVLRAITDNGLIKNLYMCFTVSLFT